MSETELLQAMCEAYWNAAPSALRASGGRWGSHEAGFIPTHDAAPGVGTKPRLIDSKS